MKKGILSAFGKKGRPRSEFTKSPEERSAENRREPCAHCKTRPRKGLGKLCNYCSRRYYDYGTLDPSFKAFGLIQIIEELTVVKSIIQRNLESEPVTLGLKFFENLMNDAERFSTVYELTAVATNFIRRWKAKNVQPLDLLVVCAGCYLTYYLDKGLVVSDLNLRHVMGNFAIRMTSVKGSVYGGSKRSIAGLIVSHVGPLLVNIAKMGIEYMKARDKAHRKMGGQLQMPTKLEVGTYENS
jgi:hypothetical protein